MKGEGNREGRAGGEEGREGGREEQFHYLSNHEVCAKQDPKEIGDSDERQKKSVDDRKENKFERKTKRQKERQRGRRRKERKQQS